jgi:hypothetical protein
MHTFPLDAALERLQPVLQSPEYSERLIGAKCAGLIAGYHARWHNAPYRIDGVECVVSSDLLNPSTNRTSRTFRVAGKIDVHATEILTGRRVIFDHKTTSEDIADFNAPYWRQLVVEGQASHYILLEWQNGRKVDYAIWDVIRKPAILPRQITTKRDRDAICYSQRYCNQELSPKEIDEFAASDRETITMYTARLARECSVDRPQHYFQRRQVPRLDAEVLDYAKDLWEHAQEIILARRNNRHARNSGACMLYRSPCKFLGICSGHDHVDSSNWTRREWVHPELPAFDNGGLHVLTNSRIRTFQTCREKHYLQYELGIERVDEEERESLFFGSTLHTALEAYFLTLKTQQEKGH